MNRKEKCLSKKIKFKFPFNDRNYIDTGVVVDKIFELFVLVLLIVLVIVAYFQTSKLDINLHPMR